jgi:capsular exopolysaccharide synthesis family protein
MCIRDRDVIIKTPIDGLEILPSGVIPPNPSELLSSNKMKVLINKLREDYDYVLIDTPPAVVVTDAAILSTCSDGVLLVCAAGQVAKEAVQRSKELLKNVNANIIGVVLNKIRANSKGYYQYYYEDYYGEEEVQGRRKKKAKANG